MKLLLLCLSGVVSLCMGDYHVQLDGSEAYPLEPQEKIISFHKPLHFLSPLVHHPWTQKLAALAHFKPKKHTVTATKTIVLQTVRHEKKHLMCFKARHGLPPCLKEDREGNYIFPTAVHDIPYEHGETKYLGILDGGELKEDDEQVVPENYERDQRHLFGLLKHTKYVTKTLWVTRVEDYVDTRVTATLLAGNCVPSHSNIPPCPEKVEHYVHFDLSHESKPVWEKEKKGFPDDRHGSENSEISRKESGTNRQSKDSILERTGKEGELELPVPENKQQHLVDKKTEPGY